MFLKTNLSYFTKLKNEQMLCYQNIINDIDIYRTRTTNPCHHESLRIFRRIVENNLDDITDLEPPLFESLQLVSYAHFNIKELEPNLTDLSLRFGPSKIRFRYVYNFIDKICDEIVDRSNIGIHPHPYLGIFGGERYRNSYPMNFICCRLTDYYRFWHLGLLGHELGHSILKYYFEPDPVFHQTPFDEQGQPIIEQIVENWEIEIIADMIGTLTVGPTLLFSHAMMPTFWVFHPRREAEYLRTFHTHPPCEFRFYIHDKILDDLDLSNEFPLPDLFGFFRNIDFSESEDYRILFNQRLDNIRNFQDIINEKFERIYPILKENIRYFNVDDWQNSKEIAQILNENGDISLDQYSPIQILNGIILIKPNELTSVLEEEIMDRILPIFTCL